MNYIGSKQSLLNFIDESINKVVDKNCTIFCDIFAGTGVVGSYFKDKGYKIIANDIQYFSFVLNRHYIGNNSYLSFEKLTKVIPGLEKTNIHHRKDRVCEYLSGLRGVKGFIHNNYCLGGSENSEYQRQYFSDENGMSCDSIRLKIEEWKNNSIINEDEYFFLLTSLLESIDKYANTASVYGAYLKQLKKSAQKKFIFVPARTISSKFENKIFNEDANELIKKIKCDILYLDPPYNHRQYATNYHMLETIAKYDKPKVKGKTGLRNYENQKSLYCSRLKAKEAFKDLVNHAKVSYIFLSYNNEGLLTHDDIREIMSLRGKYGYFTKEYNRFKADKDTARDYKSKKTIEYLHYVII